MKSTAIPEGRMLRQRITGAGLDQPADVVRWMGAVQAQDYDAAQWAIGLRTTNCSESDVAAAFAAGSIVRTHVMRPTWHFVTPEDIRWMQELTSARVRALLAGQLRQLEVDARFLRRATAVIEKVLGKAGQLTRLELGQALAQAGMPASGLRLAHILLQAELGALICSGGVRGKQFTYALLAERAPQAHTKPRDEALAILTQRYFFSHGPATVQDYAWWCGLTTAECRQGIEMIRGSLSSETIGGRTLWSAEQAPAARKPRASLHLLPHYDEYIVGYTDRSDIFDARHAAFFDAQHPMFMNHVIVSRGRIAGTWSRALVKGRLRLAARWFSEPAIQEARAYARAAGRLARFRQRELDIL